MRRRVTWSYQHLKRIKSSCLLDYRKAKLKARRGMGYYNKSGRRWWWLARVARRRDNHQSDSDYSLKEEPTWFVDEFWNGMWERGVRELPSFWLGSQKKLIANQKKTAGRAGGEWWKIRNSVLNMLSFRCLWHIQVDIMSRPLNIQEGGEEVEMRAIYLENTYVEMEFQFLRWEMV